MDRDQRKELLEAIGFVAIIASLIFVGIETRSSTKQAKLANKSLLNDSYQNVIAAMGEMQLILATNEEFHRLFTLGEKSPSELSDEEWSRFSHFNFQRIGTWEYVYLGTLDNSISPALWEAFDPFYRSMSCLKGHKRFIEENRHAHAPQFIAYLESEVLSNCVPE